MTLGNYVVSDSKTQNAYYRTNYNFVRFEGDTSPWHVGAFNPEPGNDVSDVRFPQIYSLDWIDDKGVQHGFKKNTIYQLSAVHIDGTSIPKNELVENLALACGWKPGMQEPVLSCLGLRLADITSNDTVHSILSGLFNSPDYGLSSEM